MELNPDRALGKLKHLLSSRDYTLGILIDLIKRSRHIKALQKSKEGKVLLLEALKGCSCGSIFIQPSTRTRVSNSIAISGLGAYVFNEVGTKEDGEWQLTLSSAVKGPSFADEMLTLACYFQLLVLRTPHVGMPEIAAQTIDLHDLNVSVINAGDGENTGGEHPTQSFADLDTILEGLGLDIEKDWRKLPSYSVAFVNDCRTRVIKSAALLLGKRLGMELKFICPPELQPPVNLLEELKDSGVKFSIHTQFQKADIVYVVRIPKEFDADTFAKYKNYYSVTQQVADKYGYQGVLHPWPRSEEGNELPALELDRPETWKISLDKDRRGWYIRQMQNGVPTRMALALFLLDPTLDLKKLEETRLRRGYSAQCLECMRIEHPDLGWSEKPYKRLRHLPLTYCGPCSSKTYKT